MTLDLFCHKGDKMGLPILMGIIYIPDTYLPLCLTNAISIVQELAECPIHHFSIL